MFTQSKLLDEMIAKPPREVYDLAEGEIAYVHPDHLIAAVDLHLWLQIHAIAHKTPPPNWGNRYLKVQVVPGGALVDYPNDFKLRLVPRPTSSDHYRQRHDGYLPVMLGAVE